jgi:tetratricopeptide (TPR) repeat protein
MDMVMTKASGAARSGRLRFAAAFAALLALGATGCSKLKARDMLNKGVQAYKAQQFDSAVEKFKSAKDLDPTLLNARLYLATAYSSGYVDGSPAPDNVSRGNKAVEEFRDVLQTDANNLSAIDGLGSILYRMGGQPYDPKKLEESRNYHLQHIKISPNDPDPYYWVGVIDWLLCFRANSTMRNEFNSSSPRKPLRENDALPAKLREEFSAKYAQTVDEGIAHLKMAIERRPDYDDAMAYLNLLDRQKADQVDTPEDREKYLADADALIEKVKEIKQKKTEKQAPPA